MGIMGRRFFIFFLVNFLIIVTLSATWFLISSFFNLNPGLYAGSLIMCFVLGMGGAFFSLLLSKKMAIWMMGVQIIDPKTNTKPQISELVEHVHRMSKAAGLKKMPEVGIYESPEVNAFATGPSKRNSLVAVSSGLLHRLGKDEVEAVIGHEVAHIANGDMVTMTLIQGVINTLVLFLAQLIARAVSTQVDERYAFWVYFATVIVLQITLSILGYLVVSYYSRQREFRADAGAARLSSREKMISALRALSSSQHLVDTSHETMVSFKIMGVRKNRFAHLFSTHPPIEDRILHLERGRL